MVVQSLVDGSGLTAPARGTCAHGQHAGHEADVRVGSYVVGSAMAVGLAIAVLIPATWELLVNPGAEGPRGAGRLLADFGQLPTASMLFAASAAFMMVAFRRLGD